MKLALPLLLCCAPCLFAQSANPLTEAFSARYQSVKANLIGSAEAMPEESYSFKLTAAQRPFSEWIGHTAMSNYNFCSAIKGEKTPGVAANIHEMTTKADLVQAIKDVFTYCDGALDGMTDEKALTAKKSGEKTVYPAQGMLGLLASDNEHYGNIVGYLRSKGVVPPSSRK